jgi:hypothetical protein
MAVFVVSWNLNNEKQNYAAARAAFIAHLKRYSYIVDPKLDTVWFLEASSTASALRTDLELKLDSSDRLFVSRLRVGEYDGFLHKDIWPWIAARV